MNSSRCLVRLSPGAAILAIAASLLSVTFEADARSRDCFRELRRHGEFRIFTSAIRQSGFTRRVRHMRRITCLAPENGAFVYNPIHQIGDRLALRSRLRSHFVRRPVARRLLQTSCPKTGRRIKVENNSLIFPVGVVLVPSDPEDKTLLELIYDDPYFTIFAELIRDSGLAGIFVQGISDYTVFAPNNYAFYDIADYLDEMTRFELQQLVRDHVVRRAFYTDDFESGTHLLTIGFRVLDVFSRGGYVVIENAPIDRVYSDVEAVNGVLHEVEEVILVYP